MKKWALITGASSGLGMEAARQLQDKYDLVLVARRKDRLEKLKDELSCEVRILTHDLSKEEEVRKMFEECDDLDLGFVFNNAGFGETGYFLQTDTEKELNMIDVNVRSMYLITKLYCLKYAEDKEKRYLLNTASIAGILRCGPYLADYYACKNYVFSLSLGIRRELKEHHSPLSVSVLCPGPVNTEFNQVANCRFSLKGIEAKDCIRYALKKTFRGKAVIVPSSSVRMAAFFQRFVPYSLLASICAKQQKRKLYQK